VSSEHPGAHWARLLRTARSLIRQVNAAQPVFDNWTLGGGTAMMLQIEHRESRDIDVFLSDPQQLPFLDPRTQDFTFEIRPADYGGDGARSLKFVFDDIGEIDFIVATALTSSPTTSCLIEGEPVLLDTVPEIITKKIYHRGASLTPRDIFDIAAACEQHEDSIKTELRNYRNEVADALVRIDTLRADFVNATIARLVIMDPYRAIASASIERTKAILRAI
jgi:hypothetical protein